MQKHTEKLLVVEGMLKQEHEKNISKRVDQAGSEA